VRRSGHMSWGVANGNKKGEGAWPSPS